MRKLTFSLLLVVLAATIGAGWIFDRFYTNISDQTPAQKGARHHLQELGQRLAAALNHVEHKEQFLTSWNQENSYDIKMLALDDIAISTSMLRDLKQGNALVLEGASGLTFNYYLNDTGEILALHTPALDLKQPLEPIRLALTGLFYASLVIAFLLWVYPLKRRLTMLRNATKEFGQGNLHGRIRVSPTSYIGEIEHEFNRMADRIENLMGDIKLLSTSMSHEMRTPLAKIQFGLDVLQEEADPEVRKVFLQRIEKTATEMTDMVDSALRYSRLDYAMAGANMSEVDLSDLLEVCVRKHSDLDFVLQYERPDFPALVCGDAFYLEILIDNLIGNAIKYGRSRARISLVKGENLVLSIADDGKGVREEDTESIFLPFFRGVKTEDGLGGFGIGLAVAARIAFWHKAQLAVKPSSVLSGAEFTVTFPCRLRNNDSS